MRTKNTRLTRAEHLAIRAIHKAAKEQGTSGELMPQMPVFPQYNSAYQGIDRTYQLSRPMDICFVG